MLGIGLIGCGHWGPNHARVFNQIPDCRTVIVADLDAERLKSVAVQFPGTAVTTSFDDVLKNPDVNAVVIASPVSTHFHLTRLALEAGKDVLVEKPLTYTTAEAQQLVALAEKLGRILMCGHIFVFNSSIRLLRSYISEGTLGRVYYMSATRTNLGPVRRDVNALYDLGSHDISIFNYLLDEFPIEGSAQGECYLQHEHEDVVFACLEYPRKTLCHMHVSWLNPRKERTLVVVGDKRMAVWDDTHPIESVRLYDKGLMQEPYYDSFGQFQLVLRDADIHIPRIKAEEPLRAQNTHFAECVRNRSRSLTDGRFAQNVVSIVEALQRSLRKGGIRQPIPQPSTTDK
jgi:predicted dehydrogenase